MQMPETLRKAKKSRVTNLVFISFSECADKDFLYNVDCPICFNVLTMPIKADCGHGYCMDCLYTYWEKPSWNNCCPLCRLPISNLRLLENSEHKYMDSTKKVLEKKLWKILSQSYLLRLNHILQMQIVCKIILCMIYLAIWTWTVANARNILYIFTQMYHQFYKLDQPSNSLNKIHV
ncbi:unnamed protein product [Acanthoscelides obtectus]|uniref:RING-type domain-containing protein n=1 Tax=Acanthoscelides obtectus TaxID=200917 RepID=A0A9P0K225_ACAOB|nr:unnamed protein product [Acanthoscelides obtectus]CAK1657101.1 E3 ubiquitin-protein ligase TRIM68 [Acanthoscelides obtectus]